MFFSEQESSRHNRLNRKGSALSVAKEEITPELAAMVVRQYLLPMFERDSAEKFLPGLGSEKSLEAVSGTVYAELKETDRLMTELTEARQELSEVSQNLKDAEQERQGVLAELDNLKHEYYEVTSEIESLQKEFQDSLCTQQLTDLKLSFLGNQLYEYKRLYSLSEAENKQFTNDLHEEKALNDKRRNTAAELEHGNELLRMENDIMAERLKELYKEFDNITGRRIVEDKLCDETEVLAYSLRELASYCADLSHQLTKAMNERDELKLQQQDIEKLAEEVKVVRDKLVNTSKEAITKLQKEYNQVIEQREEYKNKLNNLEKFITKLNDNYKTMRQKLKQWKQRGARENEIRQCINCTRAFLETENYNWSCKRHNTKFHEETQIYWCCGKKGREAEGCVISKHEAREDDEDDKDKEEDLLGFNYALCTSCREIGHKAHECPKDPNIRSASDPTEDMDRIEEIKARKKANINNIEVSQKLMGILEMRLGPYGFGDGEVSSLNSFEQEDEESGPVPEPFKDINSIKSNLGQAEKANRVSLESILTKEEKELRRRNRSLRGSTSGIIEEGSRQEVNVVGSQESLNP